MTPLVRTTTLAALPLAFLISMTHLAGADQGPGDGFTAGIISALGLTLQYIAFGYQAAHRRFARLRFPAVLIAGLAVALVTSLAPLLAGDPFMATREASFVVPAVGAVRLTQVMLFDFGIYLVVLGGAMTAIDSLGGALP